MPTIRLPISIVGGAFSGLLRRPGLDVTRDSAVLDRRGIASPRLFALGPVTRGIFWEITSVPDIREQCWKLASRLGLRLAARQAAAG